MKFLVPSRIPGALVICSELDDDVVAAEQAYERLHPA